MNNHLTECNEYISLHPSSACICAVLHAHGMKIMSATIENYEVNDYRLGYVAGLQKVREDILSEGPWCNNPYHRNEGGPNDCPCYVFSVALIDDLLAGVEE